jgi:branched-chain amino acid transport system permease protein
MTAPLPPVVRRGLDTFGPALVVVALALAFFPAPKGQVFQGVLLGLISALVALGLALVYRANRILNFAQADLGILPTTLALGLMTWSHLNYFLALAAGLAGAVLVGAVAELAVIRRFFRAPRLILTVATIGLAQLLAVANLFLPRIWGEDPRTITIDVPGNFEFTIDQMVFEADDLMVLILAPLAMVAVAVFLRYTNVGIAVRASAERADRASMLGVPVQRLQTVVWSIAALLSFLGLFLKAGIIGLPIVSFDSLAGVALTTLLAAIAALMLGKLTDLPAVAASAVALGVLEASIDWGQGRIPFTGIELPDSKLLIDPMLGLVIIGALLFRKLGQSRAEQDDTSTWQSADEIRDVPRELRKVGEVRAVRIGGGLVITGLLMSVPWIFDEPSNRFKASAVVIFAIIGVSLVVLTGWAGQVSLAQMSFAAVGGAVGAVATREWGLDLTLALLVAGVVGAAVAIVVGLPALRLRGFYLAVTTLAFALAATNFFLNRQFFGWVPNGRVERPMLFGRVDLTDDAAMYWFCLAVFGVVVLAVRGIRRSRTGRVLLAVRENERGAQAFGVSVTKAKLTAFATSGFIAAVAGALLVHNQFGFDEVLFAPSQSLAVFTSAVVGGLGSVLGAALGALYFQGGKWFLPNAQWQVLTTAAGVLLVLLFIPGGLGDLAYRLRDLWLRSVARRRAIVVPSLVADVKVDEHVVEHAAEHEEEVLGVAPAGPGGEAAGAGNGSVSAPAAPDPDRTATATLSGGEP